MKPPTVIVLASGRGARFAASGDTTHKLTALLHGKPVLQHTLDAVRASGLPWRLGDGGHRGSRSCHPPDWLVLPGDLPLVRKRPPSHLDLALVPWSTS